MILEEHIFAKHLGGKLFLDTNLLLVLLAGRTDVRLFGHFKRISTYTKEDFELLVRLASKFSVLVTTPHILTEVSNLANSLSEEGKRALYEEMALLVSNDKNNALVCEKWTLASVLMQHAEFVRFGLADTALLQEGKDILIVTDDYRLAGHLRSKDVEILNFQDIRKMQTQMQGIFG